MEEDVRRLSTLRLRVRLAPPSRSRAPNHRPTRSARGPQPVRRQGHRRVARAAERAAAALAQRERLPRDHRRRRRAPRRRAADGAQHQRVPRRYGRRHGDPARAAADGAERARVHVAHGRGPRAPERPRGPTKVDAGWLREVTDEGVRALASLPALTSLSLCGDPLLMMRARAPRRGARRAAIAGPGEAAAAASRTRRWRTLPRSARWPRSG